MPPCTSTQKARYPSTLVHRVLWRAKLRCQRSTARYSYGRVHTRPHLSTSSSAADTYFSPDFRVIGSLAGDAMLQLKADYAVNSEKWDYSMRFPAPSGVDDKPNSEDTTTEPKVKKKTQTPTPQLLLTAVHGKSMQKDSSSRISPPRSHLASCSITPRYPTLHSISVLTLIRVSTRRRK